MSTQNTEVTDAQNEKGLDREQEATFSLSRNAEYMDNAIAFNNKGGHAGAVPLVFAVRSIDQDVRSQIYSIATKKNPTIPRGDGTQGDPANAHPSYGDSSSSSDIVEQNATAVNPKNTATTDAQNKKGLDHEQEVTGYNRRCCQQVHTKVKAPTLRSGLGVRITYLPGQSPAKYCRRK